jgi:hypothetical protein
MKISELPTPRLRARAMECALVENRGRSERWDYNLDEAFVWSDTKEDREFWLACYKGNWDKAKELQPSLFKPMDGKPHIKLTAIELNTPINGASVLYAMDSDDTDIPDGFRSYNYCLDVSPEWYTTIQEAVEALYSFKRLPVVDKENQ